MIHLSLRPEPIVRPDDLFLNRRLVECSTSLLLQTPGYFRGSECFASESLLAECLLAEGLTIVPGVGGWRAIVIGPMSVGFLAADESIPRFPRQTVFVQPRQVVRSGGGFAVVGDAGRS